MESEDGRESLLEGALWELVRTTAVTSGKKFFIGLTRNLAAALDVQFALVSEVTEKPRHVRTLSMWTGSEWQTNKEYDLEGTPCEKVFESREMCCIDRVQEQFPDDEGLARMGVESYMGAPLMASSGEVIGHLCVMDTGPVGNERRAKMILATFASRAAAELDRIRTERQLEGQRAFLRQVIDINPSLVFAKDRAGRFTLANQAIAELYGTTTEGLIGKTDADFDPETEQVEFFRKMDLEVMDTGQERIIAEEPVSGPDGRLIWVQTIKRPLVGRDGKANQVLGVATNITELKRTREELLRQKELERQQVQKELSRVKEELVRQTRLAAIGQVAASIAHELRNPLGAINNAVFFLGRRESKLEPKWAEYLGIIRQEVQASDRIVGNLLEMSRAKDPSRKSIDLGAAARVTFERVRVAEPVHLRLSLRPDPFVISVDPEQLRQVLTNLMTNAIQAMDHGGEILIEARCEGDQDVVVLRDDGPGVDPEARDSIFEPLFTTKAKGTGLGLAICRQILNRHDASIELLESSQGAAFEIRFPRR
jgi:PAS domain S-box-containing protein